MYLIITFILSIHFLLLLFIIYLFMYLTVFIFCIIIILFILLLFIYLLNKKIDWIVYTLNTHVTLLLKEEII